MQTHCLEWMHNAQWYNAQCTMHNAQYTVHNTQCTMHSAQWHIEIARGSWTIIARLALKHISIWDCINIACWRFQASITCNSSHDTSRENKCLPEILYFAVTRKDVKTNYKCPPAKRSISWDIVTSIPANREREGAGWSDHSTSRIAS